MESFAEVERVALEDAERDELAHANAEIERLGDAATPIWEFGVAATRRLRAEGGGPFPKPVLLDSAVERPLPGHEGEVMLRCFVPERPAGVYLHLHGGGWVLGSAREQDLQLNELCEATRLAVVSVEYRLAPEHRHPVACDDAEAAALWLVEHASGEFGADRLVLGGESAGAHLAATTLLRLRDHHGLTGAFRAVNLSYGVFDLGLSPSARRFGARNLVLSSPLMAWYVEQFLGGGDPRDPDRSPLYADLEGMPPALFSAGTEDLLVDDTLFMAARWELAGNRAHTDLYEGAPHGFLRFPLGAARRARERIANFLRAQLD